MQVGYARVSTVEQNTDLQVEALKAAGCQRIFTETASGAQRDRPELLKAVEFLREGDTLVVWKLDRLARSLKQLIETVEDMGQRQIGFRSLTESVDTTTPGGRLIFHVFGALAEFERGIIRERTMAGLETARKMGRVGGRPRKMSASDVAAARAMLASDELSVDEVAAKLGVSTPTLYRYLPGGRQGIE
jgi:DNA invertase Pin-like site-specific DNA recombinase